MNEEKREQLNNLPESEFPERESVGGIISYEEFKKISEEILKEYQENPENVDINCDPEVIKKIIESFFAEKTKKICQEILGEKSLEDKINLLVKDITQDDIRILKETTENLIRIILGEEFRTGKEKDFAKKGDLVNRLWMTPLRAVERITNKIEIEKMKIK